MSKFGVMVMLLSGLLCDASAADARTSILKTGNWRVFLADDFMIAMGNGDHMALEGTCVAETGNSKASLAFATLPKVMNAGKDQSSGVVFIQVTSPSWKFAAAEKNMTLESGINLTIAASLYDHDMIMSNMGGYGTPPDILKVFVETATDEITVLDNRKKALVTFPAKGLQSAYAALLKCGGIRQ